MVNRKANDASDITQEERDKRLSKAYNTASQRLRDNHRNEFNGLYGEEAKKLGVHWEPRLTAEQKAEQELQKILSEFPQLRERLMPKVVEVWIEEPEEDDEEMVPVEEAEA